MSANKRALIFTDGSLKKDRMVSAFCVVTIDGIEYRTIRPAPFKHNGIFLDVNKMAVSSIVAEYMAACYALALFDYMEEITLVTDSRCLVQIYNCIKRHNFVPSDMEKYTYPAVGHFLAAIIKPDNRREAKVKIEHISSHISAVALGLKNITLAEQPTLPQFLATLEDSFAVVSDYVDVSTFEKMMALIIKNNVFKLHAYKIGNRIIDTLAQKANDTLPL